MSKIILDENIAEIKIKKSVFIGKIMPADNQDTAITLINKVKKEHYKATHNCSAYVVSDGNIEHQSDDGEPSGTAGRPMLEVLKGADLINCVAVVTRYFGGVLLGTGGLVRAYTQAVQEVLSQTKQYEIALGDILNINIDYSFIGKVKHILGEMGIYVLREEYADSINMELLIPDNKKNKFIELLVELTSASARIDDQGEFRFINFQGEIKLL